jgi:pyridoxal phosphate enzyme (YggS family)
MSAPDLPATRPAAPVGPPAAAPGATPPGLAERFDAVRARIEAATARAGRAPGSVALLAVSKTFAPNVVAAAAALGQRAFGENYVQEAVAKIEALAPQWGAALQWHFIGPIQSNKTRPIAEHFAWVQSLERAAIARRLSEQRPAGLAPLQVLLQVNISGEASKSGVAPAELPALAADVAALPRLALRGLMAIPQPDLAPAQQHEVFARLRALHEALRREHPGADTLSMGMSADFEAAIAEGSTLVRVGSALFGERR